MEKTIHEKLIENLKHRLSGAGNPAEIVAEVAQISRETAYRRLRGRSPFTLAEAEALAGHLGVSLDALGDIDKQGHHMFHLMQFFERDAVPKFAELLHGSISVYHAMATDPMAHYSFAGTMLPPAFYTRYERLSRYAFFRWFDRTAPADTPRPRRMADVKPQAEILRLERDYYAAARKIPSTFILGDEMIRPLLEDMRYFMEAGVVTSREVAEVLDDVRALLDDMEQTTVGACFPDTGSRALIYISNMRLDANYGYAEGNGVEAAVIQIYGINQLHCIDPAFCAAQKRWIEALIAYSTLISGSGRLYGSQFFGRQRALLDAFDTGL